MTNEDEDGSLSTKERIRRAYEMRSPIHREQRNKESVKIRSENRYEVPHKKEKRKLEIRRPSSKARQTDNNDLNAKQLMSALNIITPLNQAIIANPGHNSELSVLDHMRLYTELLDETMKAIKEVAGSDYGDLKPDQLRRYTDIIVKFIAAEQAVGKKVDIKLIKAYVSDFLNKNPESSFLFNSGEEKDKSEHKEVQVTMMMALSKFAHLGKNRFDASVSEMDRAISICLGAYKSQSPELGHISKKVKVAFMESMITSLSEIYGGALKKYENIYKRDIVAAERAELRHKEQNEPYPDGYVSSESICKKIDRHAKGEFRGAFPLWASATIAFNNGEILKIESDNKNIDIVRM